jgi:hypothetical protein
MKQFILLGFLWSLISNQLAWASPLAPVDTIAGQTQLARSLAAEACQQLATKPGQPAGEMSAIQAQAAFEQVLSDAIEKRVASIRQVAARANTAGAYEKLRASLPTAVALQLIRACPTATTLYSRFGNSAASKDALIKSWGNELCQRLAELQATGLLQGKSSAERMELFHQEFNASLTRRGPQIMQLYGAAGNSQPMQRELADGIMEYMKQQCLPTLMMLKDTK